MAEHMNDRQRAQLSTYAEDAALIENYTEIGRWIKRVTAFLTEAIGPDEADRFQNLVSSDHFDELALKLGHIEGLLAKGEEQPPPENPGASNLGGAVTEPIVPGTREVFVVHGHDGEAKESVARFLEKLGLDAIILHEQPNQGRTVIEKFETSSKNVAFAVVLLTPDDLGCATDEPEKLEPRARQNVILELGYFMGRLGRTRVCALYKGGVEQPSDFQGVVYIELDPAGAWRTKLAQELLGAKITIKLEGLLNK
jgi:predicted nucleotide-binding protein